MAHPIHPVSHSKQPFTELCALFVPVPTGISCVFSSACHTRRLSVSIQPGLPWEGRKTVDVTNCIRARRFAVTSSFHAGFLIEFQMPDQTGEPCKCQSGKHSCAILAEKQQTSNNFKTEVLVEGIEAVPGMFFSCTLMAVDLQEAVSSNTEGVSPVGGFASLVFAERDTNFSSSYLFEF